MSLAGILDEARALKTEVIDLRRRLHRCPEVGLDLPETQAVVLDALSPCGLAVEVGRRLRSVVARLDGARPGPTVLLRADMDALPLAEATGLPYASARPGAAHLCGHDAHMAMLVGAARLLTRRRDELAGRVLLMFQPGEEGHDGARLMLEEGLLDLDRPDEVRLAFALHQMPTLPSGVIATRPGTLMAAVDGFRVVVEGRGGHASAPHLTLDPVPVACAIVQAIQTFVARRVDAFEPVVVTVARIAAGATRNVIPDRAELDGTIRTVAPSARQAVLEALERIATRVAAAHDLTATVQILQSYPETVNDPAVTRDVLAIAAELLGPERAVELPRPWLVSEDFSQLLGRVPGALAFLGTRPPGVAPDAVEPLHSPRMVLDEAALPAGVAMHAAVALSALGQG